MNNKYSVLIIDDEEIIREACEDALVADNYHIITASDGSSGLKIVDDVKPDVVFIDLKMPNILGIEVLERIRKSDDTIVTIVITGYPTISSAVEAMKKGAFDFLPKPFTPEELRLITKRGIERRKLILENIALRHEKELMRESMVAQELKNPLFMVQQELINLLKESTTDLNPKQRQILEDIKRKIRGAYAAAGNILN